MSRKGKKSFEKKNKIKGKRNCVCRMATLTKPVTKESRTYREYARAILKIYIPTFGRVVSSVILGGG